MWIFYLIYIIIFILFSIFTIIYVLLSLCGISIKGFVKFVNSIMSIDELYEMAINYNQDLMDYNTKIIFLMECELMFDGINEVSREILDIMDTFDETKYNYILDAYNQIKIERWKN